MNIWRAPNFVKFCTGGTTVVVNTTRVRGTVHCTVDRIPDSNRIQGF